MSQFLVTQQGAGYGPIVSTSSITVGTGSKTFTVPSGLAFSYGAFVFIYNTSGTMYGTVTSYSGTSLVVNVTKITGSGTFTSWTINITGPLTPGPWVTATLLNGWRVSGGRTAKYRLGADCVTVRFDGEVNGTLPATGTEIFQLPSYLTPPKTISLTCLDITNGVSIAVVISTSGQVSALYGAGPNICLSGTFPLT